MVTKVLGDYLHTSGFGLLGFGVLGTEDCGLMVGGG